MKPKNIDNNTQVDSDEISLKELIWKIREWWRYLLSKWVVILLFGVLGGALGFTYAYFKKPIYTASTTFVLEESNPNGGLGNLGGLASMAGIDLGGSGGGIFQGDNIAELYKSRTIIEKTLLTKIEYETKTQLLVDYYIEFNNLREKWVKKKELTGIRFDKILVKGYPENRTRIRDSILGSIVNDINRNYLSVTKLDKKLSIIKVEVKSPNEFFAKAFNIEIVKNVNDFYVQTKTKKSAENVIILQQKTDSVRAVMNGEIYAAAAVADATPNLNPTRQIQRIAPVQRSQFSAETNKAILGALVQNLEMSKIALRKETPLIQVIDEPIFPLQKGGFGKLKGIIFGGILTCFITILFLSINRVFKRIMA